MSIDELNVIKAQLLFDLPTMKQTKSLIAEVERLRKALEEIQNYRSASTNIRRELQALAAKALL